MGRTGTRTELEPCLATNTQHNNHLAWERTDERTFLSGAGPILRGWFCSRLTLEFPVGPFVCWRVCLPCSFPRCASAPTGIWRPPRPQVTKTPTSFPCASPSMWTRQGGTCGHCGSRIFSPIRSKFGRPTMACRTRRTCCGAVRTLARKRSSFERSQRGNCCRGRTKSSGSTGS